MGKGAGACSARPAVSLSAAEQGNDMSAEERGVLAYGSKVDAIIARSVGRMAKKPRRGKEITDGEQLYQREVDKRPVLPYHVQNELCLIAQDENESERERLLAKQAMVWHNQKWVIGHAYKHYFKGRGISPNELIQAGNEGLIESVEQFDVSRGYTFITFAKNKIFMRMQRYTEMNSAELHGVRVPVDRYNEIHVTVKRVFVDLSEKLQRDPTLEELTPAVNQGVAKSKQLSDERIAEALHLLKSRPTSMQSRLRSEDGDDLEFGATLVSDRPDPVQETANKQLGDLIDDSFETLSEQEKLVVGSYLGLGGHTETKSLNRIAEQNAMKPALATRLLKQGRAKMVAAFEEAGYDRDMLLED